MTASTLPAAMRDEVAWYLKNGEHGRKRIARTKDGHDYVIGDWSWNKSGRPPEYIELRMSDDLRRS